MNNDHEHGCNCVACAMRDELRADELKNALATAPPPWLRETWRTQEFRIRGELVTQEGVACLQVVTGSGAEPHAVYNVCRGHEHIIAAAPALGRALLHVEWVDNDDVQVCGACEAREADGHHMPGCPVDGALTAAGLETQEQRDRARRAMPL